MPNHAETALPLVAMWRIHLLRLIFALMAGVMGTMVWAQLLGDTSGWEPMKGVAKAMLGALALLSLWGVLHPLKLLPLMIYELAWKAVWLIVVAGRAWLDQRVTPGIVGLFWECIGVIVLPFIIPWSYVAARYLRAPVEPWRRA